MMKVMIVEDEAGIRNAILQGFDWAGLDCTVCGAASGIEAMDLCLSSPPDIILTDIVIPGIDGITLFKYLRQKFPRIRFIIMTGYRDFEYAKDSLNLGASAFLLKPIDYDELKSTFLRVIEEIRAENERLAQADSTEEKFVSRLLSGYIFNLHDLRDPIRETVLSYPAHFVAVMEFDNPENKNAANLQSLFSFCKSIGDKSLLTARMDNLRLAFVSPVFNSAAWIQDARSCFGLFQRRVRDSFPYTVSVGISAVIHDIADANRAFLEASRAVSYKFFSGKNSINFYEEPACTDQAENIYADFLFVDSIEEILENGDPFYIPQYAERFFQNLLEKNPYDTLQCKGELFCIILLCVKRVFHDNNHNLELILRKYNFFKGILSSETLESIKELFTSILIDLKDYNSVRKNQNKRLLVDRIMSFIEAHYTETITLNDAARQVYLSPAYLSTLISTETGKTFTDIVNDFRVKKAIELMKDKGLKNYVIAEKVGFKESQYFSLVFKKYTGLSPSEYRQIYLIEGDAKK